MAQPKGSPQQKKINIKELTCTMCGSTKKAIEYYQSFNPIHATSKLPYCKLCLKNMCLDSNGNINIDNVKKMLQTIDRPFIYSMFKSACEDKNDTIGTYMKNLALNNKRDGWQNSVFEPQLREEQNYNNSIDFNNINFNVTNEMIMRWGSKYEIEEIYELEKFFNDMKTSNTIETAQDIAYLKKLAIISLNMDKALQEGNSGEAKQLGDLFSKYMADSKFRAMDKTDADKAGGIRRFCDIYSEVEKDGFIPPWVHYKKINGAKQDIVDKTIMFILNFMLKFNKVNKLSQPPINTPEIENNEIDVNAVSSIELKDLEVDEYE